MKEQVVGLLLDLTTVLRDLSKGGAGSGNFGHSGRPGSIGGSGGGSGGGEFLGAVKNGTFSYDSMLVQGSKEHEWMKRQVIDTLNELKVPVGDAEGYCAEVSTALWDKIGQPKDMVPYSVMLGEDYEHVLLYSKKTGVVIDPTGMQFGQRVFNLRSETPYKVWHKLTADDIQNARNEAKDRLESLG